MPIQLKVMITSFYLGLSSTLLLLGDLGRLRPIIVGFVALCWVMVVGIGMWLLWTA